MPIDLAAEVRAALADPDVLAALAAALRPLIAAEVRAALAEHDRDTLLDLPALAALLGSPTAAAAKAAVHRDGELNALATRVNGRRRWRRSDVLLLLERRRAVTARPRPVRSP